MSYRPGTRIGIGVGTGSFNILSWSLDVASNDSLFLCVFFNFFISYISHWIWSNGYQIQQPVQFKKNLKIQKKVSCWMWRIQRLWCDLEPPVPSRRRGESGSIDMVFLLSLSIELSFHFSPSYISKDGNEVGWSTSPAFNFCANHHFLSFFSILVMSEKFFHLHFLQDAGICENAWKIQNVSKNI